MTEKPRIQYFRLGDLYRHVEPGWYVLLPGMPDDITPERFDTWPQARDRVAKWYKDREQRRRIQAKIAAVSARLMAGDRGSGVRGSGT